MDRATDSGLRHSGATDRIATNTAAGIVTGAASGLESSELSLLVLAIGCGSSVMETAISVVGLAFVMLVSLLVVQE